MESDEEQPAPEFKISKEDSRNRKLIRNHPSFYLVDPHPASKDWYFNKKTVLQFLGYASQVLLEMNRKYSKLVWCLKCWRIYRCQNHELEHTKFPGTNLSVVHPISGIFGTNNEFLIDRYHALINFLNLCLTHRETIQKWSALQITKEAKGGNFCSELGDNLFLIPKFIALSMGKHQLCSTKTLEFRDEIRQPRQAKATSDVRRP